MLCQNCGRKPVDLIIEINDGNKRERLSLCRDCFKDYYQKFLKDTFKELVEMIERNFFGESEVCPYCGRRWKEIEETKELGCANCYKVFKDDLVNIIEKIHGKKKYKGKVPKSSGNKRDEIIRSRILLSKAIEEEDYEKAAEIRDYLRKLGKG